MNSCSDFVVDCAQASASRHAAKTSMCGGTANELSITRLQQHFDANAPFMLAMSVITLPRRRHLR